MGSGDLHEDRPRPVTAEEHTQHMFRLQSGQVMQGLRGHRLLWSLINGVLISEAAGKGYAVHRNVMRRLGGRVVGNDVLTRRRLRELMESEETARSIVNQLMTVGRSVRSTPMSWAWEGKKLDSAVKHLSWRPPFVRPSNPEEVDPAAPFINDEHMVCDTLGLGRIPGAWFTLNCK